MCSPKCHSCGNYIHGGTALCGACECGQVEIEEQQLVVPMSYHDITATGPMRSIPDVTEMRGIISDEVLDYVAIACSGQHIKLHYAENSHSILCSFRISYPDSHERTLDYFWLQVKGSDTGDLSVMGIPHFAVWYLSAPFSFCLTTVVHILETHCNVYRDIKLI
jgi:hypothetical protein